MELHILVLLALLLAAWAAGALATRVGYPAVLGELLAGIVLGPAVLGLLGPGGALESAVGAADSHAAIEPIAELGVLLLMLYIGMEVDPRELGRASWPGFLAAIGGFVVPFALGLLVVRAFGGTTIAGLFVGIAAGVTSLMANSRILLDLKLLDTRIAHVMLAGALLADTLCLVVFAGLVGFADTQQVQVLSLLAVVGKAVLFFAGTGVLGLYAFPFAARQFARLGVEQRGVYFVLLVVVALAFAELAELAGLHAILGTFAAGLFVREGMLPPRLHRELNDLVRDVSVGLLAPIFFVMSGFEVTFDVFRTDLGLFAAIIAIAFVGKIAGTALFYLPTRHGWREGIVLGAGMNGRGAVEIILAQIGFSMGLISREIFSILVFMAILTTATVPLFLTWGTRWLARRNELVRSGDRRKGTLIIGASPTARALARLLARSQPVWLVDTNPRRVQEARGDGLEAICGNALDVETLAGAHAPEVACAIPLTSNVEINVLAARELREVFLVPRVCVLVLGPDRRADAETLEHLNATMLFGRPVPLADWDHWFSRGALDFERLPLVGTAEETLAGLADAPPALPLAVERETADGLQVFPFDGRAPLVSGDVLVVARVRMVPLATTDRFDELVRTCPVLDLDGPLDRDAFFRQAARGLTEVLAATPDELHAALCDRERMSSTVLTPGLAVPHVEIPGEGRFALVVARCRAGVSLADDEAPAEALFVLAGTADERNLHLRSLSAIAQVWQSPDFETHWRAAPDAEAQSAAGDPPAGHVRCRLARCRPAPGRAVGWRRRRRAARCPSGRRPSGRAP